MNYSLFDFLQLIGALGIFIFGMKIFSDALQKVAGNKLRSILKGMTRNRFVGVLTGFGTTAITQSSSTTTVMVVSFVNAGLLTFIESTGVIMGANIGTTITAWLVSIFGFKFQITPVAISVIGIFFPFLFSGNVKLRNIAESMIGFGILFIGLEFIKNAVPNISDNPEMFQFLDSFTDFGFWSTLLFVFVGTTLTLLTQSSSAATAITLVMLVQGWITFPIAAAMVLGENIGTTVTANIAALVGNVHAKRAARFHFFFNVVGVIWMLVVITPFLQMIDWAITNIVVPDSPSIFMDTEESRTNATLALSLFHTLFNVLNVTVMFAFVPLLVRFIERIQPEKGGEESFKLEYINAGLMSSPELSMAQAKKEIVLFAKLIEKMHYSLNGLVFKGDKKRRKFIEKMMKREEITDRLEIEIAEYLLKISENTNLTTEATRKVRNMHRIVNELERLGDLYYQLSKIFERMIDEEQELPDEALEEIKQVMNVVHDALIIMRSNLDDPNPEKVSMAKAYQLEEQINALRDSLRTKHYARLENSSYTLKMGVGYLDVLNRLEKVGDHIINVSEAATDKSLKELKASL
jgi:phosphate:Na+ symporter